MSTTTFLYKSLVVFTDLDGTLIDHHTYSAAYALDALQILANHGVPVIFCSSKTFSEQQFLQQQLGIKHPFILENGSAVAMPQGYFPAAILEGCNLETKISGYEIFQFAHTDAQGIRSILREFADLKGYADISDIELEAVTGLSGNDLQRARERWYTETLITPLNAKKAKEMAAKLETYGLILSRGGRFYTIQSAKANKGKAVRWLAGIFQKIRPTPPILAAIGDSPNDIPMLASVDHAFLVQRQDGSWTDLKLSGITAVEGIGPIGFSAAINLLLANGK